MILNCFNINYFFLDFGNGYCVEMPSDKKDLDKLLDYLFSQKVEWKFYATLIIRKSKCSRVSKRKVHFTKRSV